MPDKPLGASPNQLTKRYFKHSQVGRNSGGFSIIELMIAISLFSFSLLGIMSLQIKALELLSDASLKNQAIVLASSRYELYKLSSKNIKDFDSLESGWNSFAEEKIPGVRIKSKELGNQEFYISLTWVSGYMSTKCDVNAEDKMDCFKL